MKTILTVTLSILIFVLAACNKEDKNTKKLSRHEGRWTIDYATTQTFDSAGNKLIDTTVNTPGELVLFRTGSLSALYGYRQAVILLTDSLGSHGYYFDYVFDGKRINIENCYAPYNINGTYTSVIDKAKEQQWEIYSSNSNISSGSTMTGKFIMHLSRSKN
ncbi:MAG: hypothetical protein WCI97_01645 [Bacteroidota bacterium]